MCQILLLIRSTNIKSLAVSHRHSVHTENVTRTRLDNVSEFRMLEFNRRTRNYTEQLKGNEQGEEREMNMSGRFPRGLGLS